MLVYKNEEEIEIVRRNNLLVSRTLAEVAKMIKPGVTTLELDKRAEEFIRDNGAVPGFFLRHVVDLYGHTRRITVLHDGACGTLHEF